jgi:pimeloyl-ACP methyl ester carboxylesterase
MTPRKTLLLTLAVALAVTLGWPAAPAGAQPAPPTRYSGTLPNGATWIADVPTRWNGILIIYSHGYVPGPDNPPRNSPNQPTADALLARGYALAGSSYSRPGWALATAPDDQIATLRAVRRLIGRPDRVIAFGTSMGGLVTGRLAQTAGENFDGALATCGLMGGGVDLHNYQLDGLHAINQLLLGDAAVRLVRFSGIDEVTATLDRLKTAIRAAQATPQGRARIALAAAYLHLPGWFAGLPRPGARDYEAQQVGQYEGLLQSIDRFQLGRFDVEQSAGGNPSWNEGVDYRRLLTRSINDAQVRALYRQAGLDLRADLDRLTATADITPDRAALGWLSRTSTLSGRLAMPVLTIHTTNDPLVPAQHEQEYAEDVRGASDQRLLRQAYTDHPGHCTFTPAELVAGVETVRMRIESGRWVSSTTAANLQARAESLDLGPAAFVRFHTGEFLGDRIPPRSSNAIGA